YEQILPVLEAYYTSLLIQSGYDHTDATDKKAAAVKAQIDAYKKLVGTQPDVITGEQQIAAATGETTAQTTEATKALEEWRKQLQDVGSSFVEPLSTYKDLLSQKQQAEQESAQATADATKSSKDSWKDYVKEASVSLDEYATKLEEQLTAQENWRTNLVTVTKRGGLEVGQALAAMGVEGAGITAQMANATGADFKRLKNDMIRDARLGGAGATAELDNAMKIQAGVTASGGKATAQALAKQLGLGVDQVAAIAKQYGIKLAAGINPLLTALGHPTVAGYHVAGRNGGPGGTQTKNADGNLYEQHQAEIAPGGAMRVWAEPETEGEAYIPLARSKRARSLSIWRQTGKHLDAPEAQHFASGGFATATDVPHPSSTAPYRMPISTAGDAAMGKEYAETTNWVREHGPIGAALSWAKSQVGKPYIWGGVGPEGYDCSGFMSAITNVLLRRNPYSRVGATANFPWPGFTAGNGAFTIGSTSDAGGGIGHMAGTLMGVNVESRGGQGVVVGGSARGASNSLFHTRAHLAMYGGGVITEPVVGIGARTGNSYSFGERGPETVTPSAAAAMPGYGMGGGGGGGTRTSVSVPAPQVKVYLDGKEWRGIARVEATVVVDGVLTEIHDTVHYAGG
ncbi:MAG: putative phage protein, partial [Frankiales bacterium]|nr:putative phage protein [Frankiales bacterium]